MDTGGRARGQREGARKGGKEGRKGERLVGTWVLNVGFQVGRNYTLRSSPLGGGRKRLMIEEEKQMMVGDGVMGSSRVTKCGKVGFGEGVR